MRCAFPIDPGGGSTYTAQIGGKRLLGLDPASAQSCSSKLQSAIAKWAASMTDDAEQSDLVDMFYRPLVRPLGNLVITFAQAEASLLELVTELEDSEHSARHILKNLDDAAQQRVIDLIERQSGAAGFDLTELLEAVASFWKDKERRNRYIHDEWFPDLTTGAPMTRGLPRKKAATIIFDAPPPEEVWALARRFKENGGLFSITAHKLRRERSDDQT